MVYPEPPVNPPRQAIAANTVSAVLSGVIVATGIPGLMILVWSLAAGATSERTSFAGGTLANLGLAAGLMFGAVFFAGLALAFTALSRRQYDPELKTYAPEEQGFVEQWPFKTYISFTLLGLAADTLGLVFLVQGAPERFRAAAIAGTVLQILALVVGLYRKHLKNEK